MAIANGLTARAPTSTRLTNVRSSVANRRSRTRVAPIRAAVAESDIISTEQAVATLKDAATTFDVPKIAVFRAMKALEDAKIDSEGFYEKIGGTESPGLRWRLVFTASADDLKKFTKGEGPGGGSYFPITACQKFDASTNEIKNGVFLGHVANLTFTGPMEFSGRKLGFTFTKLGLKLGPWEPSFNLPENEDSKDKRRWPFFLFAYADEDIIVARGKGGGLAFWAKTDPQWEIENGVL